MKKIRFALVIVLFVATGLLIANQYQKGETHSKSFRKPLSASKKDIIRTKWEATPSGIDYLEWKKSATGKKVLGNSAKIRKSIQANSNLEAIVTSLTLPPGSRLGLGLMVRIQNEEYILAFGPEKTSNGPNAAAESHPRSKAIIAKQFEQLRRLKVDDKILIRSHFVSHAPKYAYPIINGDYVEPNGIIIYKRIVRKGGC
jgi:hypothetical protein